MDHRYLQLAMLPGRFFDVPWSAGSPLLDTEPLLPAGSTTEPGWRRVEQGPWSVFVPDGVPVPARGWKLHVAALPEDAAEVADICWQECRAERVPFKVLRTRGLVLASQLKYAQPAGSGKVVTCYPAPDLLRPLTERLARRLAGRPAPRVLGELAVPGAPVHLRYGAFLERWTTGADGRAVPAVEADGVLVPDLRGRRPERPPAQVPPFVADLQARAQAAEAAHVVDVAQVRAVHRSNAGGVYRAVRPDGTVVMLKEARHHAGLDLDGTDARTRLRHEHEALERLAGGGATPEPLEYLVVGDSDFLVAEWIEGVPLGGALTRRHPLVRPELSAQVDGPAYLAWAREAVDRARAALAVLHARGVVHRDVQPANLIDAGDRIVLVDLESCTIDGRGVTRAVATPGFSVDAAGSTDPAADLRSLRRVHSMLVNPLTPLLHQRPDLERRLWRVGHADLGAAVPPDAATEAGPDVEPDAEPDAGPDVEPDAEPDAEALVRGIAAAATPGRADRLFPGDVEQFSAPRAALGLLHGAAGVLLALSRCGHRPDPAWTRWLVSRALAAGPFPRGLGGGAEGVAWALARLGEPAAAAEVVDRFVLGPDAAEVADVPWWEHGATGRAVALAGLGTLLDSPPLHAAARDLAGPVVRLLGADGQADPAGYRPGLCSGWSGVGLALLALGDVPDLLDPADVVAAARAALERDLRSARRLGECLLTLEGGALLPYLSRGSAASGLLAARLRDRDGRSDPSLDAVVAGVRAACAQRVTIFGGLLSGRSGLLAVLAALSPDGDRRLEELRRRLSWYTVPVEGDALLAVGDHHLRCSADLATGAAGMLAALRPDAADAVPDLLGLTAQDRPNRFRLQSDGGVISFS